MGKRPRVKELDLPVVHPVKAAEGDVKKNDDINAEGVHSAVGSNLASGGTMMAGGVNSMNAQTVASQPSDWLQPGGFVFNMARSPGGITTPKDLSTPVLNANFHNNIAATPLFFESLRTGLTPQAVFNSPVLTPHSRMRREEAANAEKGQELGGVLKGTNSTLQVEAKVEPVVGCHECPGPPKRSCLVCPISPFAIDL